MHAWRLSKYDPARRDGRGAWPHADWTSISDVGQTFDGRVLSMEGYLRVERAYVDVVVAFHAEMGAPPLFTRDVEAYGDGDEIAEGARVDDVAAVVRACLREAWWCRLEAADGACDVHFGYDLYVYLTGPRDAPRTRAVAAEGGLFLEPFSSPYAREAE